LYILITNYLEKSRLAREWEQLHGERMSGEERGRWERAAALARSRRQQQQQQAQQQQQQQANQQRIDNLVASIIDELDGPGPQLPQQQPHLQERPSTSRQQQHQPQLQQQPSTSRQQQQQPYLQEQPGTSQQQQQPYLQERPGTSQQAADEDDDRPLARLIAGLQGINHRMQQQMAEGAALEGGLTLARRREICMFNYQFR
jgi:hypothetical protein